MFLKILHRGGYNATLRPCLAAGCLAIAACTSELAPDPGTFDAGTPVTLHVNDAPWTPSGEPRSSYAEGVGISLSGSEDIALFYNDGTKLIGSDDTNRYPVKATANGDWTWSFSNPVAAEGRTWFSLVPYSQQGQRYMKSSTKAQTRIGPVQFPLADSFDPQADVLAGKPFTVKGNEAEISSFKRLVAPWRILVTGLGSSERIYAATLSLSGTATDWNNSIGGILTVSMTEDYDGTVFCGSTGGNTRSISLNYGEGLPSKGGGHPLWFMVKPVEIPAGTDITLTVTTADATYTRTARMPSEQTLSTEKINKLAFNIKGPGSISQESSFQDFTAQSLTAGSVSLTAADESSLTWILPTSPQWTAASKDGGSGYPDALSFTVSKTLRVPSIAGKDITGIRLFIHPAMTWSGGGTITVKDGDTEKATVDGACLVTAGGIPGAIERGGFVDIPLPEGCTTLSGLDLLMGKLTSVVSGAILFTADEGTTVPATGCKPWDDFQFGRPENLLPDFSYSGYDHGRTAPPEVAGLGYTSFNVCDYGAVPNDGLSDRAALIACISAALGKDPAATARHLTWNCQSADVNKIIYFPEGEYILYEDDDKVNLAGDGYPDSQSLRILAGNLILKGAGRDKTRLVIKDPLLPADHKTYSDPSAGLYSSPALFYLGGASTDSDKEASWPSSARITASASAGDFSVTVASNPQGIAAGDWVVLHSKNTDAGYIDGELCGLPQGASWDINVSGTGAQAGLSLREYHEVSSVSGNTLTFTEPLMHDIDASFDFYLPKFNHRSGVGVEDICFVGQQDSDFIHHGYGRTADRWKDDGAYKPLTFYFLTDSWVRRCAFENVSEIATFNHSANVSMYDLELRGWRGHNNARLARSSFSFVGKVTDTSSGNAWTNNPLYSQGSYAEGAGSYHGPGVAVESCGNVFWRCTWGKDAGFESHGAQPRCTLFDCCTGGFLSRRQGGGTDDMPNHLGGLVMWNFNALNGWSGFDWWSSSTAMYVVMPVLVGMHGEAVSSVASHVGLDYSNGSAVDVESLYEAQLQKRLGAVPAWIEQLK